MENHCHSPTIVEYGDFPDQFMRISLPDASSNCPMIIILHGGFWKFKYNIDNSAIDLLPSHFLSQGYAVCEIEYRRVHDREEKCFPSSDAHVIENTSDRSQSSGSNRGGWPYTHLDILSALTRLSDWANNMNISNIENKVIDLSRSVLIGHSAGGNLALWVCASGLPTVLSELHTSTEAGSSSLPSSSFGFMPLAVVALAPVADLWEAHNRRLSDQGNAVQRYIGGDPSSEQFQDACRRRQLKSLQCCVTY